MKNYVKEGCWICVWHHGNKNNYSSADDMPHRRNGVNEMNGKMRTAVKRLQWGEEV